MVTNTHLAKQSEKQMHIQTTENPDDGFAQGSRAKYTRRSYSIIGEQAGFFGGRTGKRAGLAGFLASEPCSCIAILGQSTVGQLDCGMGSGKPDLPPSDLIQAVFFHMGWRHSSDDPSIHNEAMRGSSKNYLRRDPYACTFPKPVLLNLRAGQRYINPL